VIGLKELEFLRVMVVGIFGQDGVALEIDGNWDEARCTSRALQLRG
jgi:hypothetical protein